MTIRPFQTLRIALASILAVSIAPVAAAERVLEEITVTAQKRETSLQDTPIAIAAFSERELRELGMRGLADVPSFIPNVELFDEYGTGQPTWVIRGVGLADWNANNTPAAAIYVDDVYVTSNVMGGVGLFDLERIEVLKGPQGALYGRNTSGGAVRVVSRRPDTEQAGGYATLTYGRWQNATVEGAINAPLGDRAAVRVAALWNRSGDGWQTSLANGAAFGEQDRWSVRSSVLFDASDATEILLTLGAARDNSETVLGRGIGVYDPFTGAFCSALVSGGLDDSACAMNATFYDPLFRFPDVQSEDGLTTLSDPINRLDNESRSASLRISHDFDTVRLTSITGYQDFDFALNFDYDGSNGAFGHQFSRTAIEAISQEFRLESRSGDTTQWLLGVELGRDELSENRDFSVADDPLISALLGESANLRYDQATRHTAVYGQFDWSFADRWSLGFGLRYTDETKEYRDGSFTLFIGGFPFPFQSGLQDDSDIDTVSGKISVDWQAADNAMLYASISRGFKSGGFFGGFPADGQANIAPYDEETVDAIEVGFKTQWLEDSLRLNGAVFFYDYQDVQGYLTTFSQVTQTVITNLGNIGDAEHAGAEFELAWQATENLRLQASAGWLDAKITDSDAVAASWLGTLESLADRDRAFAPDFKYTLLGRYAFEAGGQLWSAQLDYSWRDDRFGSGLSIIEETMFRQLEDYGLLGARIAVGDPDGRWELALWGQNLADENYLVNVTTDDLASWMRLPGEPRNYGLDFRLNW